jgi:hypothetical protein
VDDLFFDDETWTVRYLVVETGSWLASRRVLISPIVVVDAQPPRRSLSVDLTRDQVANSPDVDTATPVSRQMELKYRNYFGWPAYWVAGFSEPQAAVLYPRSAAAEQAVRTGQTQRRVRYRLSCARARP